MQPSPDWRVTLCDEALLILQAAAHYPVIFTLSLVDKGALCLIKPLFFWAPVAIFKGFVTTGKGELLPG